MMFQKNIPMPSVRIIIAIMLVAVLSSTATYAVLQHKTTEVVMHQSVAMKNKVIVDLWKTNYDPTIPDDWSLVEVTDRGYHYQIITPNVVTNVGQTYLQGQISGSPSTTHVAKYIALTNNSDAPAYTDTTLTGEFGASANLARVAGTYSADGSPANGDATWTVQHTFTANATQSSVQKAGLFTTNSGATLFAVTTFGAVNLEDTDTLVITWTVASTN
jgi:hypothetical protein